MIVYSKQTNSQSKWKEESNGLTPEVYRAGRASCPRKRLWSPRRRSRNQKQTPALLSCLDSREQSRPSLWSNPIYFGNKNELYMFSSASQQNIFENYQLLNKVFFKSFACRTFNESVFYSVRSKCHNFKYNLKIFGLFHEWFEVLYMFSVFLWQKHSLLVVTQSRPTVWKKSVGVVGLSQ